MINNADKRFYHKESGQVFTLVKIEKEKQYSLVELNQTYQIKEQDIKPEEFDLMDLSNLSPIQMAVVNCIYYELSIISTKLNQIKGIL